VSYALIFLVCMSIVSCVIGPYADCNVRDEGCTAGIQGKLQEEIYIDKNGIRWGEDKPQVLTTTTTTTTTT